MKTWELQQTDHWERAESLASHGWELVSVCLNSGMLGSHPVYYFKRPINEIK